MNLKDRVALVTGGASGLGRATVERLYKNQAKVVILDLQEEKGNKLASELGANAAFCKCDISNESDVKAAIDFAVSKFGRIDILVNNAAFAVAEKTTDPKKGMHNLDNFKKVVAVNTIGTFDMTRNATTKMLDNEPDASGGRGVVINVSTVASMEGQIGQVAYAASKGGVNAMTIVIARELANVGIRCVTIAPGIFDTPAMDFLSTQVKEALGKTIPFPSRLGHADEFASLVQHIIENDMLNGEVIRLDGAIRMQPR